MEVSITGYTHFYTLTHVSIHVFRLKHQQATHKYKTVYLQLLCQLLLCDKPGIYYPEPTEPSRSGGDCGLVSVPGTMEEWVPVVVYTV